MARRDSAGVRLITRQGNDFTSRFPFIVAAVAALLRRSLLIDGEAIVTNDDSLAVFDLIRRNGAATTATATPRSSNYCFPKTWPLIASSAPVSSASG